MWGPAAAACANFEWVTMGAGFLSLRVFFFLDSPARNVHVAANRRGPRWPTAAAAAKMGWGMG